MNRLFLTITLPGALILFLACERTPALPPSIASPMAIPESAKVRHPPIPKIVSPAAIPRPFSNATYFLYGGRLSVGVDSVLSELVLKAGPLLDAWYPKTALCSAPFPDHLIVRLGAPDPRIEALGFTRDSRRTIVECFALWLHYDFRNTR
jgi:hypothetical protein